MDYPIPVCVHAGDLSHQTQATEDLPILFVFSALLIAHITDSQIGKTGQGQYKESQQSLTMFWHSPP